MADKKRPRVIELEAREIALPEPLEPDAVDPPQLPSLERPASSGILLPLLAAVFGIVLAALVSLFLFNSVTALLASYPLLGQILTALLALFGVLLALLALRELRAYSRLGLVSRLRTDLGPEHSDASVAATQVAIRSLLNLYRGRSDMDWARAGFQEQLGDQLDRESLLALAENKLMTPLDHQAGKVVEQAARQVALVTAFLPLALADVAVALFANLRMIRRIAEIYGGRSGTFGSIRLIRAVFTHLAATGLVAIGDDLISSLAGGGLVSKLSRRFGEGVVNGAMTTRIGITAMELCRPMPFVKREKPKVRHLLTNALKGVFSKT